MREDLVDDDVLLFRGVAVPREEQQHVRVEDPGNALQRRVVHKPGHVTRTHKRPQWRLGLQERVQACLGRVAYGLVWGMDGQGDLGPQNKVHDAGLEAVREVVGTQRIQRARAEGPLDGVLGLSLV